MRLSHLVLIILIAGLLVLGAGTAVPAPALAQGSDQTSVTDIANPDAYQCSQPGFIGFESEPDGTDLPGFNITGLSFPTSGGNSWRVGDFATGKYNGKYPNGSYTSEGTHWAWLGENQGSGQIDFTQGNASYFSLLASVGASPVYVEAFDSNNNLLATAGPATQNSNTGHMTELKITRSSPDIAYVIVHDTGNFFLVDSLCTNAPGVSEISLKLSPATQRCVLPCTLPFSASLTRNQVPVPNADVHFLIFFPNPVDAPNGGTGQVNVARFDSFTGAQGTAQAGYTPPATVKMEGLRVVASVSINGRTFESNYAALFYLAPGVVPSIGELVFQDSQGNYGACSASVVRSAADQNGALPTVGSLLVTAGHCGLGSQQLWFYPGATKCDFSTAATTQASNSSLQCAPLGVWSAEFPYFADNYVANGYQADDFAFVTLFPDAFNHQVTINDAVPGLPIKFGDSLPSQTAGAVDHWQAYGYPASGNTVQRLQCVIKNPGSVPVTSIAGSNAGPGNDWLGSCSGMSGGGSGGPWIHQSDGNVDAVNSKYQNGQLASAVLGSDAEHVYLGFVP